MKNGKDYKLNLGILNHEQESNLTEKYNGPFNVETDELTGIDKILEYDKYDHAFSILTSTKHLNKSNLTKRWGKMKEAFKGNSKPEIKDFDELIQQILKKLFNYLNNNFVEEEERNAFGTICLNALAAFLCNLGREFNKDGENCKEKYMTNLNVRKNKHFSPTTMGTGYAASPLGVLAPPTPTPNNLEENYLINKIINYHLKNTKEIAIKTIKEFNENKIEKSIENAIREALLIEKQKNNFEKIKNNLNEIEEEKYSELAILGEF
uniref:GLOBIN domain-containing protein n=1 Tax=Meloidogyne hapla TaxID=6305 RepID=A0A1I8BQ66_MELHA